MAQFIAAERAFHKGRLVHKGQVIDIEDGEERPEWCVASAADVKGDAKATGDTRPAETVAAVRKKAAEVKGDAA